MIRSRMAKPFCFFFYNSHKSSYSFSEDSNTPGYQSLSRVGQMPKVDQDISNHPEWRLELTSYFLFLKTSIKQELELRECLDVG